MSTKENPDGTFTIAYDAVPTNTAMAMDPRYATVCLEHGHAPLELPGSDGPANFEITHKPSGRTFARVLLCSRCCALYWEPLAPKSEAP